MVARFHSAGVVANSDLPRLDRDPLLYDANGGVLFAMDIGFPWCRTRIPPVDGQLIRDISGQPDKTLISGHAHTAMEMTAADQVVFNPDKNGLDFTGAAVGNYIPIPAAVSAAIAASQQHIMYVAYVTTSAEADWVAGLVMDPFLNMGVGGSGYVNGANWLSMGITSDGAGIEKFMAVRQKGAAVNSADFLSINAAAGDYSTLTQVAFWSSGTAQNFRVKNAARSVLATPGIAPVANTVSGVEAVVGQFGVGTSFWGATTATAKKFLAHRMFIENLDVSGRDPETVLDDDWARTVARGVFV